jgi:hypothetical protein
MEHQFQYPHEENSPGLNGKMNIEACTDQSHLFR